LLINTQPAQAITKLYGVQLKHIRQQAMTANRLLAVRLAIVRKDENCLKDTNVLTAELCTLTVQADR
jgi:hypothetical protein